MDAFALALSYGISKVSFKNAIITAIVVGIFHFFMPLFGNFIGISLFEYTIFKPRYVLFLVFLILSIDMFIHYFEKNNKLRPLSIIGTIFFALSVSVDSFSVGLGISYLYNNIILVVSIFCLISTTFTMIGFELGKTLFNKLGRYSYLIGSIILLIYSFWVLTK